MIDHCSNPGGHDDCSTKTQCINAPRCALDFCPGMLELIPKFLLKGLKCVHDSQQHSNSKQHSNLVPLLPPPKLELESKTLISSDQISISLLHFLLSLVRSSSASQIIDSHRREFVFVDGQEIRISQALVRPLIDWWLMNYIWWVMSFPSAILQSPTVSLHPIHTTWPSAWYMIFDSLDAHSPLASLVRLVDLSYRYVTWDPLYLHSFWLGVSLPISPAYLCSL